MSGIELCRHIRAQDASVPFFLVTGRQLELMSTDITQELSIRRIFGKPFSPGDVIAAVNEAIEQSALEKT